LLISEVPYFHQLLRCPLVFPPSPVFSAAFPLPIHFHGWHVVGRRSPLPLSRYNRAAQFGGEDS
jgi:hypothetical protein